MGSNTLTGRKRGVIYAFAAYLLQFPVVFGSIGGLLPVPPVVVFPPLVGWVNTKIENRGLKGLGLILPCPLRSLSLAVILAAFKVLGYFHLIAISGIPFSFPAFSAGVAFRLLKEFVIAVFILAMWEELVCRGYIQTRLQEAWGFPGVILSALMFASLHLPSALLEFGYDPKMIMVNFLEMFLPGLLLSYIYWVTKSTLTTIAVHGFRNFLFVIALSSSGLSVSEMHQLRPGLQILWSVVEVLFVAMYVLPSGPTCEETGGVFH